MFDWNVGNVSKVDKSENLVRMNILMMLFQIADEARSVMAIGALEWLLQKRAVSIFVTSVGSDVMHAPFVITQAAR